MSDKFEIRKEPVKARDESGIRIWGSWTLPEIGAVLLVFLLLIKFFGAGPLSAVGVIMTAIWVKNFRMVFPERHFHNMLFFYARTRYYYSADTPDTEWRPPIK